MNELLAFLKLVPDIKLNLKYELANTSVGIITATPVVRGPITDVLLYEEGTGYGSNILNLEKSVIYIQSNLKEHAYLSWILSNFCQLENCSE